MHSIPRKRLHKVFVLSMGCGKRLAPQELDANEGDEELLCSPHDNTYQTGYKYNTKIDFVTKYNTIEVFSRLGERVPHNRQPLR